MSYGFKCVDGDAELQNPKSAHLKHLNHLRREARLGTLATLGGGGEKRRMFLALLAVEEAGKSFANF